MIRLLGSGWIVILIGSTLSSCNFSTGNKNMTQDSQLEIIQPDGNGHRILTTDVGEIGVLTDDAVLFSGLNYSGVSEITYDGSNLTRFHPEIPWAPWEFSYVDHRVLLASFYSDSTGHHNDLYLMNADGTDLVQLATPKGSYDSPHISPDLDEIVFCRGGALATIRSDGTNLDRIRSKPDGGYCDNPFFLDESSIIYRITDTTGVEEDEQVRLFNTATRKDDLIGSFHSGLINSAVGQKLLYIEFDNLLLLNVSTSQVTTLASNVSGAAFSPDGSKIVACNSTSSKLFVMDSSGANADTIYTQPDSKKWFDGVYFSPDGRYIVFLTYWQAN